MPSALLDIRKRALARADLIGIWFYTSEMWGDDQADRYLRDLNVAIETLQARDVAVRQPEAVENFRRLRFRRHRVYYTVNDSFIDVVRVLHDSMDVEQHLTDD